MSDGDGKLDLRTACHGLWKMFHEHPNYSCYGTNMAGDVIRVYTRGRIPGVPSSFGGWPVVTMSIDSQRFDL